MITVKEEFLTCDKTRRAVEAAGSDAIVMWLAMKAYCSEHLTNGFIPEEEIGKLPGAPKRRRSRALRALVECGRVDETGQRGAGLVDRTEHGWRLHDYLDHSECADDLRLKRAQETARKRAYRAKKRAEIEESVRMSRAGQDTGQPRDTTGQSVPPSANCPGRDSCARARPQPSPAQPYDPTREGDPRPDSVGMAAPALGTLPASQRPEYRAYERQWAGIPTALADDWEPTQAHQELADERGRDLGAEARKFRLNAKAKGKTAADWDAEFELWLLRDPPAWSRQQPEDESDPDEGPKPRGVTAEEAQAALERQNERLRREAE